MACDRIFACHSCQTSLMQFIETAEQAEVLSVTERIALFILKRTFPKIAMAFRELKSAKELARCIVYSAEEHNG